MQQSPSWEANTPSATQEIPIVWNRKVRHRIHKSSPPVPIQIDPVYAPHPTSQRPVLISSSHLRLGLIRRLHCIFPEIINFLRWGVVSTSPNYQAEKPPLVGCPRLLIQYILSDPPYLQAVPPSATWGRAMPWWQGPTCHGQWIFRMHKR
jgi:hypothetical protein